MASKAKINNEIYEHYGERWYDAYDDPVALLRAENRVKLPWIKERIKGRESSQFKLLDVACGAGFLCNELARLGLQITGIDCSPESLRIARMYDLTGKVRYLEADAYSLPFESKTFDVVTCLDFLEHVERPQDVIKECARVLKPGGQFFFHTFNRNFLSWMVVIKGVEILVKNTPKNMHVIDLFIKPEELVNHCQRNNITVDEMTGLRPKFSTIPLQNYFSREVPESLEFQLTSSLALSYMGVGQLNSPLSLV